MSLHFGHICVQLGFGRVAESAFDFLTSFKVETCRCQKLIAVPDQSEPKASLNLPCQIEDVRATCAAHQAIITL